MFIIEKLEYNAIVQEQDSKGEMQYITYTHSIVDSDGIFKPEPCQPNYDILKHNIDYLLQELYWFRHHAMPDKVEYKGNVFAANCKDDLREKCESSIYANGVKFSFKCVSGMVMMDQSDAQAVRDAIEMKTQGVFDKYFTVETLINNLTMQTLPEFDINEEWGKA